MPLVEPELASAWHALLLLVVGFPLSLAVAPRYVPAVAVVAVAYALRAVAAIVNTFVLPLYPFDADWTYLHGVALEMADGGFASWLTSVETGREFYSWLVAWVYLTLGEAPFLLIAVNVLLGTALVVVAYALARTLGASRMLALAPAAVTAVFPSLLAYSVQPSREPLITLALAAGILGLLRWFRGRRVRDLMLGLAGMLLAGVIHSAFIVGLMVAVAFVVAEYGVREWRTLRGLATTAIMSTLMLAGVATIGATGLGLGKVGFDVTGLVSLSVIERVSDKGDIDARGGYVREDEVDVDSYADVARRLPGRIALFLLKPYPWEVRTLADVVGVILVATCVVAAAALALRRRTIWTTEWRFLALFLTVQLVLFSWGTVNYGTAARHKSKFVPILVVFLVAPAGAAARRGVPRASRVLGEGFSMARFGVPDPK